MMSQFYEPMGDFLNSMDVFLTSLHIIAEPAPLAPDMGAMTKFVPVSKEKLNREKVLGWARYSWDGFHWLYIG